MLCGKKDTLAASRHEKLCPRDMSHTGEASSNHPQSSSLAFSGLGRLHRGSSWRKVTAICLPLWELVASEFFPAAFPPLPEDFTVLQTIVTDKGTRTIKMEGGDFRACAKLSVCLSFSHLLCRHGLPV